MTSFDSVTGLPELSTLEVVELSEVWRHEAHSFTPWLLANQRHLERALGIELDLEEAEYPVGPFRLDLIGSDRSHGGRLIVENQLGETDHKHLGQVMTYAAGTDAATVVWIARSFREEHRQALDWLNEHTDETVRFFGVTIGAVRIATSPPAPVFTVVARPNDWQKIVRTASASPPSATSIGGRAAIYAAFWATYLERVRSEHPGWVTATRGVPRGDNWYATLSPVPHSYIDAGFAAGSRLRHEVYIDKQTDPAWSQSVFDRLVRMRGELEDAYGRPLDFEPMDGKRAFRIAEYRADGDILDTDSHPAYLDWFIDAGVRLRRALAIAGFDRI